MMSRMAAKADVRKTSDVRTKTDSALPVYPTLVCVFFVKNHIVAPRNTRATCTREHSTATSAIIDTAIDRPQLSSWVSTWYRFPVIPLFFAGYVPLPVIVKKVVLDHAGSSLGEFRHVILAMLDTYSYDTAIHRYALCFEHAPSLVM